MLYKTLTFFPSPLARVRKVSYLATKRNTMNSNTTDSVLEAFLRALPNRDRAVFLKEIVFGSTPAETADALDLKESEVRKSERRIATKMLEHQL